MSKWTIDKIKNQIKFGDFVSIDGDDFNDRVFDMVDMNLFYTYKREYGCRAYWNDEHLVKTNFKFFDRQGKEITVIDDKVVEDEK